MIIIKNFEINNGVFIRTDQLDGETDWKLRKAPPSTQKHDTIDEILFKSFFIIADPPSRKIYDFNGVLVHLENYDSENNNIREKNFNNSDKVELYESLRL